MYDRRLDTFMQVAQLGSFSKAAEALFVTPTAVIKQINGLEKDLGAKLFVRSAQGVHTTPQGDYLKSEIPSAINAANTLLARVERTRARKTYTIRLATSLLQPHQQFANHLSVMQLYAKDAFEMDLVPISDASNQGEDIFSALGTKADIAFAVPSPSWLMSFDARFMSYAQIGLLIPSQNSLSYRFRISENELAGQKVVIAPRNYMPVFDEIYERLNKVPGIILTGCRELYSMSTLNQCVHDNAILVTFLHWSDIHPNMATTEVIEWCYHAPQCLLYSKAPPDSVKRLIKAFETARDHGAFEKEVMQFV